MTLRKLLHRRRKTASHTQLNVDHGRIEKRICRIITDMDWICSKDQWEGLQTIIEIISERTHKATGEKKKNRFAII